MGAFFPGVDKDGNPVEQQVSADTLKMMDPREKVNVIMLVPVGSIRANPYQPRTDFDELKLHELADSIREHGLIQPVTVRHIGEERFELISGERRLRATRMMGAETIPAYIRDANDEDIIAMALVENIQREQLNPVETALGYQRLLEECSLTQEEVAKRVGKNRTTVTNMLRLLNLPAFIQSALKRNVISVGHARALITLDNERVQEQLLERIIENDWSVRQVESAVKAYDTRKKGKTKPLTKKDHKDIELLQLSTSLQNKFSTKVNIRKKGLGGEIKIEYYSDEELERLLSIFENID